MGFNLRWSLPVAGLKCVCTLLMSTATPAPALHAHGLHQYSFIFGIKMPQAVLAQMKNMDLWAIL